MQKGMNEDLTSNDKVLNRHNSNDLHNVTAFDTERPIELNDLKGNMPVVRPLDLVDDFSTDQIAGATSGGGALLPAGIGERVASVQSGGSFNF